ncbi:hypothetical protein LB504_013117 [Fusarium proliferatum]|nr:hypothetical protein LB504_013117 [Fusarium proliferatum]
MEPAKKVSTQLSAGQFECTWQACEMNFKRKSDLARHYRKHTGEKPYSCSFDNCPKRFERKDHLSNHIRSHTQEKPYQCTKVECGRFFSSVSMQEVSN